MTDRKKCIEGGREKEWVTLRQIIVGTFQSKATLFLLTYTNPNGWILNRIICVTLHDIA